MDREKTVSSKRIYDGRVVNLRVDTVKMQDGSETTREVVEHADCIAVVAIDDNDCVLMVRQYRKAAEKELLEIPAGGIDAGETAEEAVRREMQEETGYLPHSVERLCGFYTSPGHCTEYLHVYLARDLHPSRLFAEDTADISLVRVPVKEIPTLLASGKLEDAKSIAGLGLVVGRGKGWGSTSSKL